jgi:hypothetical protein
LPRVRSQFNSYQLGMFHYTSGSKKEKVPSTSWTSLVEERACVYAFASAWVASLLILHRHRLRLVASS